MSSKNEEQQEYQGISKEKKLLITVTAIALGTACYVQGYSDAKNGECNQSSQQIQGK